MANEKLEAEVTFLKKVVDKLDTSIEKITDTSAQISKLLAVHNTRLDTQERRDDRIEDEIKVLHGRITENSKEIILALHDVEQRLADAGTMQHNDLHKDIHMVGDRVNELERWKWYIAGGIAVFIAMMSAGDISTFFMNLFK